MSSVKKYWRVILLMLLTSANIFIWYAVKRESPSHVVVVGFLNIGQGDAIYIESPTHNKIMIDGGPTSSVLNELTKVMPFYDRAIDTLLITNPDADHYSGFIDILKSFSVKHIIEPGTHSDTARYKELEKNIVIKNIPKIIARRGMIIHLGGGADLEILFPDQDVSHFLSNDGSIVSKLMYGKTSVMLTGDAPSKTEEYILSLDTDNRNIKSTILKEGHHGSRTSASELFIKAVSPAYDIISAGLKNRYNHPHKETIDLLEQLQIPTLITFERGTIIATSDGTNFKIQTEK